MKRKVIQIAGSTQLVSLPRAWALAQGIKKGDELEVEAQGNRIVISLDKAVEKFKKTEIDVTNLGSIVQRVLHALYKRGYDEVLVKYASPELLQKVEEMLHDSTIGYEIVEQKQDHCIIKAITGEISKEFDAMLRRTFLLLKTLLEGIVESIENEDDSQVNVLRAMEGGNNKYTGFCRRIINKNGLGESWRTALTYALVEELEKIADECKYLCDYVLESKNNIKKSNRQMKELYRELFELFNSCYESYYSFEIHKIQAHFGKRKKIIKEAQKFFKIPCGQARFAHYLLTMSQQIANILSIEMELNL